MTQPGHQIPIYFVNLDRAPVRRQFMEDQALARGLILHRVIACDGEQLEDSICLRVNPPTKTHPPLTKSEIGCFLSHRRAWEQIVACEEPWGCVFEDDIALSDDIHDYLRNPHWIPPNVHLIKLETFGQGEVILSKIRHAAPNGRYTRRLRSFTRGTGGYMIHRDLAAAMLDATKTFYLPVDAVIFADAPHQPQNMQRWQLTPAICIQQKNAVEHQILPEEAEERSVDYSRAKPRTSPSRVVKRLRRVKKKLLRLKSLLIAQWRHAELTAVSFRK